MGNLRAQRARPNVYIAPCTLSYKLVLEAETLINDHLQEIGKSRYIITDDEFSKPQKVLKFFSNLLSLDAKIVVRFSKPVDLLGNPVDEQGRSLDPHGRPVSLASYVSRDGEPFYDDQRDMQYTNEASASIASAYLRDNVLMSTNVVGYAIFDSCAGATPSSMSTGCCAPAGVRPR